MDSRADWVSERSVQYFPNILGHETLFTKYLEGSVPAKFTLGNQYIGYNDFHFTKLGGLSVIICAGPWENWWSVIVSFFSTPDNGSKGVILENWS